MTRQYKRSVSVKGAFSLLELLVVLVIIAIIGGLLFPVFARSRRQAREAVCLSNLRQIGMSFRMYMQDYDNKTPPNLVLLVPNYLSSPQILVCPSDKTGNYAYLNWGMMNNKQPGPYPQSYDYFSPFEKDWKALEARGPRAGYVFDRLHGDVTGESPNLGAPFYSGHTLRLNMDGSVVTREIHYPTKNSLFDVWYLENYNPGEEVPVQK